MLHSLYNTHNHFFILYRWKEATYKDYLEHFNNTVAVLDQIRATSIGNYEVLTNYHMKGYTEPSDDKTIKKAQTYAREGYCAVKFLCIPDWVR